MYIILYWREHIFFLPHSIHFRSQFNLWHNRMNAVVFTEKSVKELKYLSEQNILNITGNTASQLINGAQINVYQYGILYVGSCYRNLTEIMRLCKGIMDKCSHKCLLRVLPSKRKLVITKLWEINRKPHGNKYAAILKRQTFQDLYALGIFRDRLACLTVHRHSIKVSCIVFLFYYSSEMFPKHLIHYHWHYAYTFTNRWLK